MHDSINAILRGLTVDDISAAQQLSARAGWNQTSADWRMLIELAPEGCLAIEVDGTLAATTTLLCYGQRLAWIGMVLTMPQFRGRGFARRLLTEALQQADRQKIETVKLDATDQGKPLYERMGFRFEQAVERWTRAGSENAIGLLSAADPEQNCGFPNDANFFGADRTRLLKKFTERNAPLSMGDSYLFVRPGRQAAYFGPCVSEHDDVRALIHRGPQAVPTSTWAWDLLPANTKAVAAAREFGFAPQRRLSRMVRGRDLRGREEAIYAIAGFELG